MANDSIQRNTRWVQTFDRILEMLNLNAERPVSVLQIEDGREVVVVQPNAFTISRMYATGRPDGMRPHGVDSYYDYFFAKLRAYEEEHGTGEGFQLESEEWEMLFEESFHRYTRYLSLCGHQTVGRCPARYCYEYCCNGFSTPARAIRNRLAELPV